MTLLICSGSFIKSNSNKTHLKWSGRDSLRRSMRQPVESQYLREHSRVKRRDKSEVGGDRRQSSEALTNCTHIATNCDYVGICSESGRRGRWTALELHLVWHTRIIGLPIWHSCHLTDTSTYLTRCSASKFCHLCCGLLFGGFIPTL